MVTEVETEKSFKQTEVGLIPSDWEVKPIKEVYEICNNLRYPISETIRKEMQGEYPYYGPTKIQDFINEYRISGEYCLIGEDGDHFLKWYDMPMTLLVSGKFNVNNHAHVIKAKENLISWFYYFFKNRDITQYLTRQGAGRYKLTKAALKEIPVVLPALIEEQTAIVTALSDADALITSLEKLIAKKQNIKQGAMQKLLQPKEGWVVKKLGEVGEIITGSTPPTQIKEYWNGAIPWITPTDISAKKNIYNSEREISTYGLQVIRKLPANTLLVTCIASIGKNAILRVNGACNQQINAIVPNENNDVDFLYYLIENNKQYLLGNAGITATLMISKKDFSEIIFSFPNKPEQQHIATILSDMDAEIEKLQQQLAKYKMIKQGMMQNLLTGKIRLV